VTDLANVRRGCFFFSLFFVMFFSLPVFSSNFSHQPKFVHSRSFSLCRLMLLSFSSDFPGQELPLPCLDPADLFFGSPHKCYSRSPASDLSAAFELGLRYHFLFFFLLVQPLLPRVGSDPLSSASHLLRATHGIFLPSASLAAPPVFFFLIIISFFFFFPLTDSAAAPFFSFLHPLVFYQVKSAAGNTGLWAPYSPSFSFLLTAGRLPFSPFSVRHFFPDPPERGHIPFCFLWPWLLQLLGGVARTVSLAVVHLFLPFPLPIPPFRFRLYTL